MGSNQWLADRHSCAAGTLPYPWFTGCTLAPHDLHHELANYLCLPYSARKDMILPLSKPIVGKDGMEIGEIFVPKGTNIAVSILRANREPEIWGADAHVWKPARCVTKCCGLLRI